MLKIRSTKYIIVVENIYIKLYEFIFTFIMYVTEEGDELSSKRKLIKKNRDSLLEDFEPMVICDREMSLMFEEEHNDDEKYTRKKKGRRKRAESLLEMCDKLPNDKLERIRSSYLVKHLISPEKVLNYEEIGKFLLKSSVNSMYIFIK